MIDIYTSGNARKLGDDWIGAYAYSIYLNNKAVSQHSCGITPATQNVSEMMALAHAIHTTHQQYPNETLHIHTKSMYIIGGIEKNGKMKTNQKYWTLLNELYNPDTMSVRHLSDTSVSNVETNKNRAQHLDMLAKQKLKYVYTETSKQTLTS